MKLAIAYSGYGTLTFREENADHEAEHDYVYDIDNEEDE